MKLTPAILWGVEPRALYVVHRKLIILCYHLVSSNQPITACVQTAVNILYRLYEISEQVILFDT